MSKIEVHAHQVRKGDEINIGGHVVKLAAKAFYAPFLEPAPTMDADIWEFAAVRRAPGGQETSLHLFIEHDPAKCWRLPESFAADHQSRFPACHGATTARSAMSQIYHFLEPDEETTLFWVGSAPDFDATRVQILLEKLPWPPAPRWNHQLIGIVPLMLGHLRAQLGELPPQPWKSEQLSRLVGVDPDAFARHTAMGDVEWTMAVWDTIMGDSK